MYFPQANSPTPQIRLKTYTVENQVILNIQFLYVDAGGTVEVLSKDDLDAHLLILMDAMLMDDIYQIAMGLYPYHEIFPDTEFLDMDGDPITVYERYFLQKIEPKGFFAKQGVGLFPRSFIYAEADMIFLYDWTQLEIPGGYVPQDVPVGVDPGNLIAYNPSLNDHMTNPISIWNSNQLKIFSAEYDAVTEDWNILVNPFLGMDLFRPVTGIPDPVPSWLNPCLYIPPYYLNWNWFNAKMSGNCLAKLDTKDQYGLYNLFESSDYQHGDGIAARTCLFGGYLYASSEYRGLYFCQRLYDTCSTIIINQQDEFYFAGETMRYSDYISGAKPTIMKYEPGFKGSGGPSLQTALTALSFLGIKFPWEEFS